MTHSYGSPRPQWMTGDALEGVAAARRVGEHEDGRRTTIDGL